MLLYIRNYLVIKKKYKVLHHSYQIMGSTDLNGKIKIAYQKPTK